MSGRTGARPGRPGWESVRRAPSDWRHRRAAPRRYLRVHPSSRPPGKTAPRSHGAGQHKAPVQHVDGGQTACPWGHHDSPTQRMCAGRTSAGSSIVFSRVRSRRALTGATRDWLMRQRMYRQRFAVRLGRCCQWSVGRRRSQRARHSLGVPIRSRPVLPHRLCVMSLCSQPTTPAQGASNQVDAVQKEL